jgi:hypothetical protein
MHLHSGMTVFDAWKALGGAVVILFGTLMAVNPTAYIRMLGPIWPERAPGYLGY